MPYCKANANMLKSTSTFTCNRTRFKWPWKGAGVRHITWAALLLSTPQQTKQRTVEKVDEEQWWMSEHAGDVQVTFHESRSTYSTVQYTLPKFNSVHVYMTCETQLSTLHEFFDTTFQNTKRTRKMKALPVSARCLIDTFGSMINQDLTNQIANSKRLKRLPKLL